MIFNSAAEYKGPVTTKWLNLNTAPGAVSHAEGIMYYNDTYNTFNLYNDDSTLDLSIGHQMVAKIYNNTGVALPGGKVISIDGVDGSGFGYGVLADATDDDLRNATTGLVFADIANGSYGYVVMQGILRDVDTSAIVAGSPVWLNTAEPGGITATEPTDNSVTVGTVLTSHATTGTILINIKVEGAGANIWYNEPLPPAQYPSYVGPRLMTNEATNGIFIVADVNEATGYSIVNENAGNAAYAGVDLTTDVATNIGGGIYAFGVGYYVPRLQNTTAMWSTTDYEILTARENTEFRIRLGNKATDSFEDVDTDEVFKIESDFQTSFPELTEALILAKGDQSALTKKFVDDNFAERYAENAVSTGLHSGGVLSINASTTTFDVSAGSGLIVDNVTDPDNPVITHVEWSAILNTAPTNILTQPVTYISVDSGGSLVQSSAPPTATNRRNNIYLGVVVHSNNVNVNAINLIPVVATDVGAQLQDVLAYIGFQSIEGNLVTYASIDLTIQKTAGIGFKAGSNFQTLDTQPHEFTMAALNPVTFRYRNQDGTEGSDVTNIDPTTWDNAGVTTTVSSSSKATIQRFFIFPSNIVRVQRGQEVFNNFATAVAIAGAETFVEETNIAENGLYLGSLIVQKNATDLSDSSKALFVSPTGVQSTASVNTTLQAAYNVSTIPQIVTDAAGGAVIVQIGSGADTDTLLAGRNTAGTEIFSVTGEGNISLSGLLELNKYGAGTITGIEAYLLSTTSTGNIIETPLTDFATSSDLNIAFETLSTGLNTGGAIAINGIDNSKFDISAGTGIIVDHSASPPTVTEVSFGPFSSQTITNLATDPVTDIAINAAGSIVQQKSFTNEELRGLIFLGGIDHNNNTTIDDTFSVTIPTKAIGSSLREFARAVGDLNLDGNIYSANGVNLNINKSAGLVFSYGRNFLSNVDAPHELITASDTIVNFGYVFNNGSGIGSFTVDTTTIDPNQYDNGTGTLASVGTNNWTIQRVLFFPNANKTFVQYGVATYNKLEDALDAVPRAAFIALAGIKTAMVRGYIIIQEGETDLNNAVFLSANRFGAVSSLSSGISTALSDLTDTTITSVTSNEILKWDGSAWINNTLAEAGIASSTDLNNYLLNTTDTFTGTLSVVGSIEASDDIWVTTGKKFILDGGSDEFAFIMKDVANVWAKGANEIIFGGGGGGNFHFIEGETGDYQSVTASALITDGGASTQVVLGDGTLALLTSLSVGDADTLDTLDSSQFLRSDVADTKTVGNLIFNDNVANVYGTGLDTSMYFDGVDLQLVLAGATDFVISNTGVPIATFGRTTGDLTLYSGDVLANGADASHGRIWSDYYELTVPSSETEGWYKVMEVGAGLRRFTLRIQSAGDNSNSIDEFEISTAGYNFQHQITNLSGSRYNTPKLLEIKTNNPASGGTTQVWVRLGGYTTTDTVHFYTTYGTLETIVKGVEPTWEGKGVSLIYDATLRQDYSIDTTAGVRATQFLGDGSLLTGVDADTFDSLNSTQFLRSDVTDIKTSGNLVFNDNVKLEFGTGSDSSIRFQGSSSIWNLVAGDLYIQDNNTTRFRFARSSGYFYQGSDGTVDTQHIMYSDTVGKNLIFTSAGTYSTISAGDTALNFIGNQIVFYDEAVAEVGRFDVSGNFDAKQHILLQNGKYLYADNNVAAATRIHGINAGNVEYVGSIDQTTTSSVLFANTGQITIGGGRAIVGTNGDLTITNSFHGMWEDVDKPTNWGNSMHSGSVYESATDINTLLTVGESHFLQSNHTNGPAALPGYVWNTAGGDTSDRGIKFFANLSGDRMWWREGTTGDWTEFLTTDAVYTKTDYFLSNSLAVNGGNTNFARVDNPAVYAWSGSNKYGTIKIDLGHTWSNWMATYEVDIFEYSAGRNCKLIISGYDYSTGSAFLNESCVQIGGTRRYKVRFCQDGANVCILISDIDDTTENTAWQYPRVELSKVSTHISLSEDELKDTAFSISMISSIAGFTTPEDITGGWHGESDIILRDNNVGFRLEAGSDPVNYYTEFQNNYDAANRFNINVGGSEVFGSHVLNEASAETYISGFYGVSIHSGANTVSAGTTQMFVDQAGDVSIGHGDPQTRLDIWNGVANGTGITRAMKIGGGISDGDGAYIEFSSSGTDGYGAQVGGRRDATGGTNSFFVRTGGNSQVERFTIDNNGDATFTENVTGNSFNGIYRTTVSLTSAQVKLLNTTPTVAIAAPGAGKIINVLGAVYKYTYVTTAYSAVAVVHLKYTGASSVITQSQNILDKVADTYNTGGVGTHTEGLVNTAVEVRAAADPTLGDGLLDVYITYEIVDVS